ncbi:MAG: transglycosylase domain-containing protein [Candidatus Pacebacteria bacterium]|nr:transglycosylase domain-containing protein [Candidatus Paceibacterota bacterium]
MIQKQNIKMTKKTFSLIGLILIIACVFAGLFVFFLAQGLPDPSAFDDRVVPQSTKIYDRTGKILLYEIHGGEKRTVVSLEKISPYVLKAVLAAEDHNFYKHHGFSIKGFARAMIQNLLNPSQLRGGSTITQQLARNAFLTLDKTMVRKIREALLTIKIEKNYSKDEIIELYLNQINFGHNVYGIESASKFYFNKEAENLTLAEATYLIALIQSPNYLSPFGNHLEDLESRKEWILSRIELLEYYSKEEVENARQEKVVFSPSDKGEFLAPHFVMYVRGLLYEKFSEEELEKGGYTIITTLDMNLQNLAEDLVEKYGDFNEKQVGAKNMGFLAEDPNTGQILAMVGSRDYWDIEAEGNVNTTLSTRQPGSSFKPIVYATLFEKGFLPENIVFDVAIDGRTANFSTNPQSPYLVTNYDSKTRGPVSLRTALAESLNIPAVKVLYLAGVQNTIDSAKKFGITTLTDSPQHYGLSLVLGGGGIKLTELVHAYSVFNQDGIFHPQSSILQIKDSQGVIMEEFTLEQKQVINVQTARLITDVLSDNSARAPTFSWDNPLHFNNFQVAAKTGTDSEYRDAWTVGYTTSLTAGVWVGNNDRSIVSQTGAPGAMLAAPCWHEFMEKAIQFYPPGTFNKPLPYTSEDIIRSSIPMLNGQYISSQEYKNINTEEIIINKEVHNILYYVNKNNLLDSPPLNPLSDSQFWVWETPVLLWAQRNIPNFDTEYNQNLGPEYIPLKPIQKNEEIIEFPDLPQIEFISPDNGVFVSSDFNIEIEINSTDRIIDTKIYLNQKLLGSLNKTEDNKYTYRINWHELTSQNEIKIEALDSFNQKGENSIIIFK